MTYDIHIKSKKSYLADNTGITYDDLQKENAELKGILQLSYGNFVPLEEYQKLQQKNEKLENDKRIMLVQLYKANDKRDKLKQENVDLKLQLKGTTHCYDETELKAFKKKLNDIVEHCRTTQMTFEEFIELERIINK